MPVNMASLTIREGQNDLLNEGLPWLQKFFSRAHWLNFNCEYMERHTDLFCPSWTMLWRNSRSTTEERCLKNWRNFFKLLINSACASLGVGSRYTRSPTQRVHIRCASGENAQCHFAVTRWLLFVTSPLMLMPSTPYLHKHRLLCSSHHIHHSSKHRNPCSIRAGIRKPCFQVDTPCILYSGVSDRYPPCICYESHNALGSSTFSHPFCRRACICRSTDP